MEVSFHNETVRKLRIGLLLTSGLFSLISLFMLTQDPIYDCPGSKLRLSVWFIFSIQFSCFLLLLMHFIYLGFFLRKLGKVLFFYYVYVVGAMVAVQYLFFKYSTGQLVRPLSEPYNPPTASATTPSEQQQTVQDQPQDPNNQSTTDQTSSAASPIVQEIIQIDCFKHSPLTYMWLLLQIVLFYLIVAYVIAMFGAYICWQADEEERKIKLAVRNYMRQSDNQRMLALDDDKTERLLQPKSNDDQEKRSQGSSNGSESQGHKLQQKK